MLKSVVPTAAAVGLLTISANAASSDFPNARIAAAIPENAMTVTDWYKQDVYDSRDNKIGEIHGRPSRSVRARSTP